LINGARIAVTNCMNVRPREKAMILADTNTVEIGQALFEAALKQKAEAVFLVMKPRGRHGEEPPRHVAKIMEESRVILIPTTYSMTHTQARKKATRAGARIATMPGITMEMMSRGGMTADFGNIKRNIRRVGRKLANVEKLHISTEMGTDLTLVVRGRKWILDDTGIARRPGEFTNLPAGEIFIPPVEGSAEGVLVVDGAFPGRLDEPVIIKIKEGLAKKFSGGKTARSVKSALVRAGKKLKTPEKALNVAEFGIGMNPNARIIGNVLEDEKVKGTIHIAFGDNFTFGGRIRAGVHIDGIVKRPTVEADGKIIIDSGKLKI